MTGLEKLTEKILADARADAAAKRQASAQECEAIRADFEARAEAARKALYEQAEKEQESIVSRAKSASAMEVRNCMLDARAKMVEEAFEQARRDILAYPDTEYAAFLVELLTSVLQQQLDAERILREEYADKEDEELPVCDAYVVLLNARDRDRFGGQLLSSVRNALIGRIGSDVMEKVSISDEAAAIDGGLILRCGDVECNCSLSMLLGQVRAELEGKVSALLFEGANG